MFWGCCFLGECESLNVRCTSGECILPSQICDGHFDCADYTDEIKCGKYCVINSLDSLVHINNKIT